MAVIGNNDDREVSRGLGETLGSKPPRVAIQATGDLRSQKGGNASVNPSLPAILPPAGFFAPKSPAERAKQQLPHPYAQIGRRQSSTADALLLAPAAQGQRSRAAVAEHKQPIISPQPKRTDQGPRIQHAYQTSSTLPPRQEIGEKRNTMAPSNGADMGETTSQSEKKIAKGRRRRYKDHRGGNKFALAGLLITSEDNVLALLVSIAIAIAFPVLWLIFDASYTWHHYSPAVPILFAYIYLVTLSSMLVTSLKDPGILPRDLDPDPPCTAGEGTGFVPSSDPLAIPVPRIVRVCRGVDLKVKWCDTCHTYRPPRSSHCRSCNNCIMNIDHHCTFLNTCIGRRNYSSFTAFLIGGILTCFFIIAFSALHIYGLTQPATASNPDGGKSFREALAETPVSAVLFCVALGIVGPLATLLGYHIRLVCINRTTVEQIRINATKLYNEKPQWDEHYNADHAHSGGSRGETCGCCRKLCAHCGCDDVGQSGRDPNPFAFRSLWRNTTATLLRPIGIESWIIRQDYVILDERQPNPGARPS